MHTYYLYVHNDFCCVCFTDSNNSNRVSAIFILRTLFLVFVDVTSSKTSSRVIPRNNSSNNLLRAVFWLESDKNTARNKLFEELFEIRRSTYLFWYWSKNCLFPHFFFLLHNFFYLQHRCIALPFFCMGNQGSSTASTFRHISNDYELAIRSSKEL